MTVRAYLAFVGRARGLDPRRVRERLDHVVSQVHLRGVLDQPIETLSKGFKRRVGIAQAIIHDPPVLIMDEPTDGLDPNQKHEVRQLIRAMGSTKAIVLSTHILEEVEAICTRAVVIAGGRTVFDGTPAQMESRAPAAVTRNRLDHVFRELTGATAEVAA
jgi:ABC-2 type transport system ATP-binding protein